MKQVVIIDGVRTPIGEIGGALKDMTAQDLATVVMKELLERTKLDPALIDEVVFGCVGQMSDAPNITRVAALNAGIPQAVPAFTVARNCASGMNAVTSACQAIQAGDGDIFLVGGVESMSSAPYIIRGARYGLRLRHAELTDTIWEGLTDPNAHQMMGRTAENLAEQYDISRDEQDAFAIESHRRAFRATREGRFREEITPVSVPKKYGPGETITQDEGIKPTLNKEKLALYPTIFKEHGTVTPGNSCGLNDAAAAILVMSKEKADELGYTPMATIRSYAYAGCAPEVMGIAPTLAAPKALKKAGLTMDDMDLVEVNEAFAAQYLAVEKVLGLDRAKTNVNGGAIALGHPVGCTGARFLITLMYEMKRRDARLGLATLCVEGGQAGAMIIERSEGRRV